MLYITAAHKLEIIHKRKNSQSIIKLAPGVEASVFKIWALNLKQSNNKNSNSTKLNQNSIFHI